MANLQEVEQLAKDLMRQHNLNAWTFKWVNTLKSFGHCNETNKYIALSRHFIKINSIQRIKDTILHEIAHAIVGTNQNHNWLWVKTAKAIGCSGRKSYTSENTNRPVHKYKFLGVCPNCKYKLYRVRQTQKMLLISCGDCCDKYNHGNYSDKYKFNWRPL